MADVTIDKILGEPLMHDHTANDLPPALGAATAGAGIDITDGVITNTDLGSSAVASHNSSYDHTKIATAIQTETDPVWTSEKNNYSTKAQADLLYAPISVVNYTLPTASTTVLGGIKVGSRLSILDGVLSADATDLSAYSTKLQADALYAPISVVNYTLPTAAAATLGGIKVGTRLTITDGVLSADVQTTDISGKEDVGVAAGLISTHQSTYDHTLIATALQSETDPVFTTWLSATPPAYPGDIPTTLPASDVYAWAKAATKPSYTYSEVGAQVAGTYSTDIHANITALDLVSGENTGDQTRDSLGIDTDDAVQFARVGLGVAPDANRVFVSAATLATQLPLFERTGGTTNDPLACNYFLATKTTDMGDGFGVTSAYQIKDDAGVNNTIGAIGFVRSGADNSGDFIIRPYTTGTGNDRLKVAKDGHITLEGVTSTGATGTGKFVFDNTPTLVTPVLGAATGTSLNIGGASGVNLLQINSAATPTVSQFRITANNAGSISLFNYSADNCALGFDVDYNTATTWTARDTSAIILRKLSDVLNFYGDGGLTSGNTYTPTIRSTFSALTGIWTMNTTNTNTGQATLNINPINTITSSGNNFNYGINILHKPSLNAGVTDSGLIYGLSANVLRAYSSGGNDRGTLARLGGLNFGIGHFNTDIFSNPTTTNCYGVNVTSYYNRGAITNSYSYFAGANQTIATPSAWTAGAAKAANAIVRPTVANGFYYVAQNAGTTHATTEPTWTATENATNTDNDITWFAIRIPSITNEYGVYITSTTAVNYFGGNVSALSFTDRTPFFEGDALTAIKGIKGKDGELDHSTLPEFAKGVIKEQVEKSRTKINKKDLFVEVDVDGEKVKQLRPDAVLIDDGYYTVETELEEKEGRDLGAMISILTEAVKQLSDEIETLKGKK